jgi:hypothetical protein
MGERSYVEMTFSMEGVSQDVHARIVELADEAGSSYDENSPERFEVVIEEAYYGFDEDEGIQELVKFLIENEVAFTANDGGSYDWPQTEYAWKPGMPEIASRMQDGQGNPVLTGWKYDVLIAEHGVDILDALAGHFGDDPTRWL